MVENRSISEMEPALRQLRARYDVDSIYLFGSRAAGTQVPSSDIDLCVLLGSRDKRILEITREIRIELFHRLNCPVDVVVYDSTEFRERHAAGASFERAIVRDGIAV